MAWSVGLRCSVVVDQSFGSSRDGEMDGLSLICAVMTGRSVFRTSASISWMPMRYPVDWSGAPWTAIWSS